MPQILTRLDQNQNKSEFMLIKNETWLRTATTNYQLLLAWSAKRQQRTEETQFMVWNTWYIWKNLIKFLALHLSFKPDLVTKWVTQCDSNIIRRRVSLIIEIARLTKDFPCLGWSGVRDEDGGYAIHRLWSPHLHSCHRPDILTTWTPPSSPPRKREASRLEHSY